MRKSLKILATGLLFFTCSLTARSQTFMVICTDDRSRYIVQDILIKLNVELTDEADNTDYIVECQIISPKDFKAKHKGRIIIYDREHTENSRTEEVKRNAAAGNGFNASADIFQVLAEDHMPQLIEKIKEKR